MPALISKNFRIHNAEQFKEALDEPANSVIYFFIGGSTAFPLESFPPAPGSSYANTNYEPWRDMFALKRISGSSVSHAIKRYNWTLGTVYSQYDDKLTDFENDVFYVMTENYNVYKCLFNNNGASSTSQPSGTSTTAVTYADGYVWKFMYSVSTGDALKFVTSAYLPVKTLTSDDGSSQWSVQNAAINGSIDVIKLTSGGANYIATPTVTISGDGSGANAIAIMSGNTVSAIQMVTRGSNYTTAQVSFSGGSPTSAATATPIISPIGGHGSDPTYELNGRFIVLNARLDGNEGGLFNTSNDFRKIGLVRDPLIFSGAERSYASEVRQTYRYTLTAETGNFTQDETVVSGSNTASVIQWDSTNKYLYTTLPSYQGFANTTTVTGQSSGVSATIVGVSTPTLKPYSGDIIYLENRIAILRSDDQVEDVKLILQF